MLRISRASVEPRGHELVRLEVADAEALQARIVGLLSEAWIVGPEQAGDFGEICAVMFEFGVDLEDKLRRADIPAEPAKRVSRLIKDRGDVAELIGCVRELDVRAVSRDDFFAPVLWAKLKRGLTTHRVDGVSIFWGVGDGVSDRLVLSEWKHTTDVSSIYNPFYVHEGKLTLRSKDDGKQFTGSYRRSGMGEQASGRITWFNCYGEKCIGVMESDPHRVFRLNAFNWSEDPGRYPRVSLAPIE